MAELETKYQLASMDSLYCLAQPSLNLYIHCFRIFWSLGHPLTRFEEKTRPGSTGTSPQFRFGINNMYMFCLIYCSFIRLIIHIVEISLSIFACFHMSIPAPFLFELFLAYTTSMSCLSMHFTVPVRCGLKGLMCPKGSVKGKS